jgi:aspartate racemase
VELVAALALFSLLPAVGRGSAATLQVAPTRLVGIFGGMGPEATANLYAEIVRLTPAKKDQDHLPTLIYSRPQVPDRSACIASGSREIVPYLEEAVRRLERGGASFIAIPCNTVHYYHADMQRAVRIPVLNMITEAVDTVTREHPRVRTVGLLATNGTLRTRLYEDTLQARGLRVLVPPPEIQQSCVMDVVYSIKAGGDRQEQARLLAKAGDELAARGAEVLLLGCTEIPLAFDRQRARVPVVNATEVLAKAAIREYHKKTP